jgi:probable phosphoglycerate mutase
VLVRTLYVVTHPEAAHHVEGLVGGWHDSRLTAAGVKAAGEIAGALRDAVPAGAAVELYSSDLRRTAETAEVVGARFGVRPVFDGRLRERSFGEVEGKSKSEWDRVFVPPPAVGDRMGHVDVPGAETRAAVARRVYAAVDEILESDAEHQILVTHGFAMTYVVAAWIGMPPESLGHVVFKVRSGSISTLHEDDVYRGRLVMRLGDARHLG